MIVSASVFAQGAGNTGLSFLKIGFGARNLAMGDLGVTSANDLTALYYNPALLSQAETGQIFVTHNEWIQDVKSELLGANFSIFGLPFAIGLNTTSVSGFEIRTKPTQQPDATFNVYYFYGSLSTAFNVIKNLSAGLTIKYLNENILSDEASGLGFDIGLHYKDIIPGLNAGAAIRNLGSMNQLRNQSTKLPVDLRAGLGYNFRSDKLNSIVTITGGVQKYTEANDTHFLFGSEVFYNKLFALRLGYMTGYESKGITAGAGVLWNKLNFDYAFTPFDFGLGSSHTISLMYTF